MNAEQQLGYLELIQVLKGGKPSSVKQGTVFDERTVLRAYMDALGTVSHPEQNELEVSLNVTNEQVEEAGQLWEGAQSSVSEGGQKLSWYGLAALDLLGSAFDSAPAVAGASSVHHNVYVDWCTKVSQFVSSRSGNGKMSVKRVRPDAVLPSKQRISDSGYDVTLLYEKKRAGNVIFFGTGIIVEPPFGWYFDVVPRSSITKLGYILANSVGVIDRAYRGELFVPLIKEDPEAPELTLPQRVVQLIPRPIVHFPVVEVTALDGTTRGERGFGSSGT